MSNKSKKSTVNIDKSSYNEIRDYCNKNSYKISAWAQTVLLKEIRTTKNNKSYE